ncbi:MAG: hypothetical protein II921_09685 [Treponema sp.]|nr:hypothetical protein [Treponema sp.]
MSYEKQILFRHAKTERVNPPPRVFEPYQYCSSKNHAAYLLLYGQHGALSNFLPRHTSDNGGSDDPKGEEKKEEEEETPVTVNAAWDFSTQPTGFPTSDGATDAVTALALASTSGSGATLTATGRWKWVSDGGYIQAQASSGKTVADAATWTTTSGGKWLTLTLAGKAKVTLKYAGAGGLDVKRFVAVVSGSTVTWGTDSSGIDTTEATKELTLEKGEYTIAMNGSRIYTITCVATE